MFALLLALQAFDPFGVPAGAPIKDLDVARGNDFAGYVLASPRAYGNFKEVTVLASEATGVCAVVATTGHIRPADLQNSFESARSEIQQQIKLVPDPRFPYVPMQSAFGRDHRGAELPSEGWSATWFRVDSNGEALMSAPLA